MFPLKDTDFWWHLREGDSIRRTGTLPVGDTFTFGAEGHPWIDLHWTFQVLLSLGYELGGVPLLTLAKCAITCLSLLLLLTARRRDWPVEVMLLAWIPALIVLAGRMYVRPETISLLYLSAYLAVLFRIDERPWLAFLLPVVQVLWVNVQGLFILGPILLGCALIDAAVRPGAFSKARKGWWRKILAATALVGLACFLNPYGIRGALFPLQLASTMADPVFSKSIGELQSIPDFVAKSGWNNPSLQLQMATILLGLLSFVVPMLWGMGTSLIREKPAPEPLATTKKKKTAKRKKKEEPAARRSNLPSLFRLMIFFAFTALSFKATRNSHQFAAVVGALTAWNLGEWTAAMRHRHAMRSPDAPPRSRKIPKLATLAGLVGLIVFVGSGRLYAWLGEGRTVGIHEEPHWFPREAVKAAGRPGYPDKSICFHNGHAAYYEYEYAPERKTFADARLEVMGVDVYKRYIDIEGKIAANSPGWGDELLALGNPLVLTDNIHALSAGLNATMLTARDWRCVWFDPVASLYVHKSYGEAVGRDLVDFSARHFSRFATTESLDLAGHVALAKAYFNAVYQLIPQPSSNPRPGWREAMRPLISIGLDHARKVRELDPDAFEGWKYAGLLEFFRELPPGEAVARFRLPFDPVQDLSPIRAIHSLQEARKRAPRDGNVLATLIGLYQQRGMNEECVNLIDDFVETAAATPEARASQARAEGQKAMLLSALGTPPSLAWRNLSDLTAVRDTLIAQGRVATLADLLERAYPAESRTWPIIDQIALLRLPPRPGRRRSQALALGEGRPQARRPPRPAGDVGPRPRRLRHRPQGGPRGDSARPIPLRSLVRPRPHRVRLRRSRWRLGSGAQSLGRRAGRGLEVGRSNLGERGEAILLIQVARASP